MTGDARHPDGLASASLPGDERFAVLAVDGPRDGLGPIVSALADAGYDVRRVADVDAALAVAEARPPSLVLLDLRGVETVALATCRRLREHPALEGVPVVTVGTVDDPDVWTEALRTCVADFVTAPVRIAELLARVRTQLSLRNARTALDANDAARRRANARLEAEVERRRGVESDLRRSLDAADRSRLAMLGMLEDHAVAARERELLRTAIEQAAEVVFVTDPEGRIRYANPAFERTSGYSHAEVLGKKPSLLKSGVHDDAHYRDLWRTITSGRAWAGRFVNRRKDGSLFTEEATIAPVFDAAGAITGYVAVKRDVTQQLRMAEQLQQAQKMESVGRLAGGVAHDFNNLLTVIVGYGEMVQAALHPSDPLRAKVDQILSAGRRSAGLTRQFLAFSRRQTLKPVVLDLNALLTDLQKLLGRLIGEDVHLELRLAPGLPRVLADPGQLEQVVMNLAVNSRDAMPTGGRLVLSTGARELPPGFAHDGAVVPAGPYVALEVTDTGTGMDAATLGRIFEPFFTTKERGKGTGLGLSTVYGIVKQSGGHLQVDSEVGRGTTFRILFPPSAGDAATPEPRPAAPSAHGGGLAVLLVEDEEPLRPLFRDMLVDLGYRVHVAANGGEALLKVEDGKLVPDVLLTDVVMPGMSGPALATRLRRTLPRLKVLYVSGYTDGALESHGASAAGGALLHKPFTADVLATRLAEVLAAPTPPPPG
ncbi:MAG: response regulator [Planctomycetia bacterium]|nr:response regulator [Planctomycetia bacterium]